MHCRASASHLYSTKLPCLDAQRQRAAPPMELLPCKFNGKLHVGEGLVALLVQLLLRPAVLIQVLPRTPECAWRTEHQEVWLVDTRQVNCPGLHRRFPRFPPLLRDIQTEHIFIPRDDATGTNRGREKTSMTSCGAARMLLGSISGAKVSSFS